VVSNTLWEGVVISLPPTSGPTLILNYTAVDMFQERILKQGPQDNESALEQAKDEQISDMIRGEFKKVTGRDFPVADK